MGSHLRQWHTRHITGLCKGQVLSSFFENQLKTDFFDLFRTASQGPESIFFFSLSESSHCGNKKSFGISSNVAQKNGCYSKCKDSKQGAAATKSLGAGW